MISVQFTVVLIALCVTSTKINAAPLKFPEIVPGDILEIEDDSVSTRRNRLIKITSVTSRKYGYLELPGSFNTTKRDSCDSSDYRCYSSTQRVNPSYGIDNNNRDSLNLNLEYMSTDTLRKAITNKTKKVVILQRKRLLWGEALIDPKRAKAIPSFSIGSIINIGYDQQLIIAAKIIAVDNFGIHLMALDSTGKKIADFQDTSNVHSMIQDFIKPHILIDYNDLISIQMKGVFQVIGVQQVYPWEKMAFYVWRQLSYSRIIHNYVLTNWPQSDIVFPAEEEEL